MAPPSCVFSLKRVLVTLTWLITHSCLQSILFSCLTYKNHAHLPKRGYVGQIHTSTQAPWHNSLLCVFGIVSTSALLKKKTKKNPPDFLLCRLELLSSPCTAASCIAPIKLLDCSLYTPYTLAPIKCPLNLLHWNAGGTELI